MESSAWNNVLEEHNFFNTSSICPYVDVRASLNSAFGNTKFLLQTLAFSDTPSAAKFAFDTNFSSTNVACKASKEVKAHIPNLNHEGLSIVR